MSTVLFTFPSRYSYTIGLHAVFSLAGWCRRIQPGFLPSRPTQDPRARVHASPTGLSPPPARLPRRFGSHYRGTLRVLLPPDGLDRPGLGCSASARRYSRNHCCFLFLRLLRCFSSAGSPPGMRRDIPRGMGCPIRTPADQPPLRVPADFRSLARPSSPRGAQASPVRPSLLASRRAPFCRARRPTGPPARGSLRGRGARRIFGFSTSMNFPREKPGKAKRSDGTAPAAARPERRCSSRTFRYGYLVTT